MSIAHDVPSPLELLKLPPDGADRLLDRLEAQVPVRAPVTHISDTAANEAVVFGDSHGDWRSTEETVRLYREGNRCLIGLGDYVDRTPDDCGEGSVANALYLLSLAAAAPDRVFLIQGNHEGVTHMPFIPLNLPEEVDELWGPDSTRYDRLVALLERGPFAVTTSSGAYLAHAGFPRGNLPTPWTRAFESLDEERFAEITWAEADASRIGRGVTSPWGSRDLDRFLSITGLRLMLRGHDPDLTGRVLYGGRCLTLHTCRIYERFGGVIVAIVPLQRTLRTVADLTVLHLSTEGKSYPPPA
jgi:hypothetical protein